MSLSGCVAQPYVEASDGSEAAALGSVCAGQDLLTILDEPFTSSWDAFDKLECVEQNLLAAGDRRAIFVSVYRRTTFHVATSIDEGNFEDTAWVAEYLTAFANLYREALVDWEAGDHDRVPKVWRKAFEAAERGDNLIVQDVLMGLIAHVTRDLPFALERVSISENRASRYRDHVAVNDVLLRIYGDMDSLLADVYSEALGDSLGALMDKPVVEWVFGTSLKLLRERAWRHAALLADAGFFRGPLVSEIEFSASTFADLVRAPQLTPAVMEKLHEAEGSMLESEFCDRFVCTE